jgi:hypothetical protein
MITSLARNRPEMAALRTKPVIMAGPGQRWGGASS